MKQLAAALFCFALCAAFVSAGGTPKKGLTIEGKWVATAGQVDGKKIPAEFIEKLSLTVEFKSGKYSVIAMDKEVESGNYKVSGEKKPLSIDLAVASGPDKGKTQLGIYRIEGDVLTIAVAKAGKDRPKDFEGTEGGDVTTLKRAK